MNANSARTGSPHAAWLRALERIAPISAGTGPTLTAYLSELATRLGPHPALVSERESFSYADLAERASRFSGWARQQGIGRGEAVCLLMPNRAEYAAAWLGLSGVGVVVALLNTNLAGDALLHAIGAASPRHIIVDAALEAVLAGVRGSLPTSAQIWTHGESRLWPRIDREMERARPAAPDGEVRLADPALLIYTSGTTGLPKAARVSHRRVMEWSCWFAGMLDAQPQDRMYDCLPMYHSVGGVVALGAMLTAGGSVLIRERFSASRFWDDVIDGDCTLFQYIGELCRYLTETAPHPRETAHRLRLCCGNGLRGDVWEVFQQRFRIPRILEFYAATEANLSLYNCEGRPGAIGRVPPFLAHRFPIALIRIDVETGEPLRAPDGLCMRCSDNQPGEALGLIGGWDHSHGRAFEGYTDEAASERKILRDVLAPGDAWFRTGDLMRRDKAGFFYFLDRLGDTFRWKGENVSTEEVATALRACKQISDAVVYGVAVPGADGRAGMAAITLGAPLDFDALHLELRERLPDYARPLFLRICSQIAATGTFKPVRSELAREGFDPAYVADALYFNDRAARCFVKLDAAMHDRIVSGTIRL